MGLSTKNIFIIIVTYNGKQWYDRCFGSLRVSSIPIQTIVIDNASSDDSGSFLKENYPEVILIESDKNLGFGQANNLGMRYALNNNADYVFLLNQDAWLEPNTLTALIEVHKKNPQYGILSPMHLNAERTQIEKGLLGHLTYPTHINLELISDFYIGLKKDIYEVKEVNAAAWLIPRRTLETVGGFDPIFFHYGEDDNYQSRVIYHGLKVGIVPSVTICHDTERRIAKTEKQRSNFDKWLLQRATDLMYPVSLKQQILFYQKQAFAKLIFFNFSTFKENKHNAKFLLKKKKEILHSKEQNKKIGPNWL